MRYVRTSMPDFEAVARVHVSNWDSFSTQSKAEVLVAMRERWQREGREGFGPDLVHSALARLGYVGEDDRHWLEKFLF